jgi:hypothetical protein
VPSASITDEPTYQMRGVRVVSMIGAHRNFQVFGMYETAIRPPTAATLTPFCVRS